jgi:hypothetical protein
VYQSALQEQIAITGTGFKEGMQFTLEPPLQNGVNYDLEVSTSKPIAFALKPIVFIPNTPKTPKT